MLGRRKDAVCIPLRGDLIADSSPGDLLTSVEEMKSSGFVGRPGNARA